MTEPMIGGAAPELKQPQNTEGEKTGAGHHYLSSWKTRAVIVAGLIIIAALFSYLGVSLRSRLFLGSNNYVEPYVLIADKVSQSASIIMHLPKGISTADAAGKVSFEPAISGSWIESKNTDELVFQPSQKLELGKYYTVTLAAKDAKLTKDFLVDADPKIVSIFPAAGTEANEFSKITVVFNRPMVPLTVLDAFSDEAVKLVEITPATPGKFKWISTHNLQFIPETGLMPSSHYNLHIKSGFVSVEGLSVPEATHSFITRPLRYESVAAGKILFDQPLRIFFNQAVDLEKTKNEVTVTDAKGGSVLIVATYGTRIVRDANGKETSRVEDKSVLEVYQAQDRFNRKKLWDFETAYNFQVRRAVPLVGDINLEVQQGGTFTVEPIISDLRAESPSSTGVSPDIFDPRGRLWVTFVEPIDKDRTAISATHLKEVGYGETCKTDDEGYPVYSGNECEKTTDFKKLYLSFDEGGFKAGQQFSVEFKKIVNKDGLQLNPQTITKPVSMYPALKVIKTVPGNGETGVSPTIVKLCTNTPLEPATEDNFPSRFQTNLPYGKWDWYRPNRIVAGQQSPCAIGEFENTIRVGLAPESDIHIDLHPVDDFGQKTDASIDFKTGKSPEESRNFFHMQKVYNVTSPERTKLTYAVENLGYVNLNICTVSPEQMLRYLEKMPESSAPPSSLNCMDTTEKLITLPDRFWTRNYFQVNLADYFSNPLGHYILTFSNPDYRRVDWQWNSSLQKSVRVESGPVYERTFVTVTRLAAQEKRVEWRGDEGYDRNPGVVQKALSGAPQNIYWVSQFGTLDPVQGASVTLYDKDFQRLQSVETDGQGIAKASVFPFLRGAVIKYGDDSTIISESVDLLQYASAAHSAEKAYIYTDRPIYRPSQEVFVKGIDRIGYDGNYETLAGKKTDVEIRNSKGEVVYKENVEISEYGTFTAHFTLDAQAPLGTYSIIARGGAGYGYFDVEEYVGAPFKVEASSDKDEYISGDTAKIGVDARYFFGVPVEGGEVTYSVTSQDYYFDRYHDGYFNFGSGWYSSFYGGYGDKFLTRGKVTLSGDGKAAITESLDFSKYFKDDDAKRSKIFVFNVTVKNSNGQSVSSQKSFIVHRGEYYLGVSLDKTFFGKGDKFIASVKSVDTQGKPVGITNIAGKIYKIKWDYFRRQEVDGRYYYKTDKKTELVQSVTLSTDKDGNAKKEFSLDKEGEYEFTVEGTDARGNPITAVEDFYVYGEGEVTVRPTNNETLDLATDKQTVDVGDKVNVVIKSPFQKAKALVTLERGKVFSYEVLDIIGNLYNYAFTVTKNYIPNVYFSAVLLSPRPEVKYGQIQYKVNTKQVELSVKVSTNKTHYLPGEEVKLTVETKDFENKPVSAELSLAVADVSVLALKGNPKKNPVVFFYDGLPLTVVTASNIKNILYEAEVPAGTKGGGGAAEAPGDLAKRKRGEFRDTAFWKGVAVTDASGRAEISFKLPDNLTTWQVESLGITKDTKLGVGYSEFMAQKDVMVVPLRPRFIIPGDEFDIGAKVFNQTDKEQALSISIDSKTLEVIGPKESKITLKSNDTYTVYFSVKAPSGIEDGNHTFILSAKNGDYEDTVENSIPITRNQTYETVATANYTQDKVSNEYVSLPDTIIKDSGGLNIKMSATLAVFLSDALQYLFSYPYGCSEQIASKLSSIAIVKRGLNVKNIGETFKINEVEFEGKKYSVDEVVKIGLGRIYQNQTSGGGMAYYTGLQPDYYLTLSVLNALIELKNAGYAVDDQVVSRAAQYLFTSLSFDSKIYNDKDLVIVSAYTFSRLPQYNNNSLIENKIAAIANDRKFVEEDISSNSLAHLAMLMASPPSPGLFKIGYPAGLKEIVFKSLENRLVIDSRGSHLPVHAANFVPGYYETPIKDTALFLKAYVADKRDSPILDKVIRWISRSRFKDGAWGSTNNTVSVVDAFTDYLNWKKETESNFNLSLALNNNQMGSFEFGSSTILQTFSKFIPVTSFRLNSIDTLSIAKENKNALPNAFYYDMDLKYFLPVNQIPPRDEGFSITRNFYGLKDIDMKEPLVNAKQGDVVRGHLTIIVPEQRNLVTIEDFIPAGMELVNFNLATEDKTLKPQTPRYNGFGGGGIEKIQGPEQFMSSLSGSLGSIVDKAKSFLGIGARAPRVEYGGKSQDRGTPVLTGTAAESALTPNFQFTPDAEESHDDRLFLFKERLAPGVYDYDYFARALVPGKFNHLPAVVSELYFPENFGRTKGDYFTIQNPK